MDVVAPGSPPRWELYAGTPCWIELVTTDPVRAGEFYAGLFRWEYEGDLAAVSDGHVVARHEGVPVASIRKSRRGRSEWCLYLATDNCTAAVDEATDLGAQVRIPPEHVSPLGTKTVLTGPCDADFGLLEPTRSLRFDVGLPGTLMWAELVTIKAQTADSFFQSLFGYTGEQFGAENRSDYSVWYLGDESVLARVSMIRDFIGSETRPHWLLYLGVDPERGTEELVHQAIGLGGRVRVDPYDSALGRVAVLRDPTGARFAVVDSTQAPGDYGSAANYDPYED